MRITIAPVTADFVAEVYDVDLTQFVPDDDFAAIANAFWKYSVLIFPDYRKINASHCMSHPTRAVFLACPTTKVGL